MLFTIALGIVFTIVYVGNFVQCTEHGKISLPTRPKFLPIGTFSDEDSKPHNNIQNGKLQASIRFNQELYSSDSARNKFCEKLKNMIITTESFLKFKPNFPKIYRLTISMYREVNLKNVSLNLVLGRIFKQIYYFSKKCQEIEQVYSRKLNLLSPEPMFSSIIDYLPMRIIFMSDEELEVIVKRMDEVNKKLSDQFDKLCGCELIFDKKIIPLAEDVKTINTEMTNLYWLFSTSLRNLDAIQKGLDSLDKKTAKIHEVMIAKDVQNNIYQAAAVGLDEAVKTLQEFIKELDGLMTPPPE